MRRAPSGMFAPMQKDHSRTRSRLLDEMTIRNQMRMEYQDIWGTTHKVSEETRRRLLNAMGVCTESASAMEIALAEEDARAVARPLPTVAVVSAAAPGFVPLTLPVGCEARGFSWAILEESEELHDGQFVPSELRRLEELAVDGQAYVRFALELPRGLGLGYHRLAVEPEDGSAALTCGMALIVTPESCYLPPAVRGTGRVWGPAVQLYALRSERNWGVGDFTDLRRMVEITAELGGAVVGLNPLHALFPHNPWHCSPYSPSSRLFTNIAYLDVEAVEELFSCRDAQDAMASDEFQQRLAACRGREIIDYGEIVPLKRWIIELLYSHFRSEHLEAGTVRAELFRDYVQAQGEALRLHALQEALQEHFHRLNEEVWGWPLWPADYRDPESAAVAEFCEAKLERVEFFQYVQWLADGQLAAAAERATELGLGVGLYADLAVSVDRAGAEVWGNQQVFAHEAAAGAPPDALAPQGQNWGLPPMIPKRLRDAEYAPFVSILRANMRHAGALRIDHVMGLMRLYWVSQGRPASEGAYVHYPFEELIGIVALESHRNGCMVIGEDLGTVPQEVRSALEKWGVLSYRLLLFERKEDGSFLSPRDYPRQALVAANTHDLPTLAGYWAGRDLEIRDDLSLFPSAEVGERERASRGLDRERLLAALTCEGLLPKGGFSAESEQLPLALRLAALRYLGRSPAQVMVVQWEDLLGVIDQANLPGTTDEHPNWRRRLPVDIEDLLLAPFVDELKGAMSGRS